MSDDEYEYEYDEDASDEEMEDNEEEDDDGSFEYTDEEEELDDVDVALENAYYNAKGLRDSDLSEAAEAFESVLVKEAEALASTTQDEDHPKFGPWSYKSLKQLVKLRLRTNDGPSAMTDYGRLLECISSPDCAGVSPNAIEKGVNGMLDRVASLSQGTARHGSKSASVSANSRDSLDNPQVLARDVYDATLTVFHSTGSCPNERLWFKTNLKYGQLLYEMNETAKLQLVIRDLLKSLNLNPTSTTNNSSSNDPSSPSASSTSTSGSSTNLMEIYALQIQLYSRQKDNKKLREIFSRAMRVQGGIPHPRTLALIQELGGKMHMASREFEAAGKTFFQAFKSYDEAGDPSRLRCLKYLVMASMLHASSINPFDSQEARPYRDDPEILAMTNLVQAFHNNEIQTFERILQKNEGKIMDDEFVREHLADLLRTIRTQVLQKVIRPYTRISLAAIAKELNGIPVQDVESLLVGLILDGKLDGRIDQVNAILLKNVDRDGSITGTSRGNSNGEGNAISTGNGGGGGGNGASGGVTSGSASASSADWGGGSMGPIGSLGDNSLSTAAELVWGGNTLEVQNSTAVDQLTKALEKMTSAVTSSGSKSVYHQIL